MDIELYEWQNIPEYFVEVVEGRQLDFGIRVVEKLAQCICQFHHFKLLAKFALIGAYQFKKLFGALQSGTPLADLGLQNKILCRIDEELIMGVTIVTEVISISRFGIASRLIVVLLCNFGQEPL